MAKNTAFSPNPDITCQITGTPTATTPGFTGDPSIGAGVAPTYAATISLEPFLQNSRFVLINGVSATSATTTLNTTFVAPAGATLLIQVNASGGTITATFGTGFRKTGTLAPTVGTSMLIEFVSDGITWNEIGRTSAALA